MAEKMMQESLKQFLQLASQDQELQEKLKVAPNCEAYICSCVELGKEKGYRFNRSEVAELLNVVTASEIDDCDSKLSEEELEAVAGGNFEAPITLDGWEKAGISPPNVPGDGFSSVEEAINSPLVTDTSPPPTPNPPG